MKSVVEIVGRLACNNIVEQRNNAALVQLEILGREANGMSKRGVENCLLKMRLHALPRDVVWLPSCSLYCASPFARFHKEPIVILLFNKSHDLLDDVTNLLPLLDGRP